MSEPHTMNERHPVAQPGCLYGVLLGGRADGCNIELHDVAFGVGSRLEDLHEQLLDQWFGKPQGLHVDAYVRLDQVDGYRIELRSVPGVGIHKLFFINLGGYQPDEFAEQHAYAFVAATGKAEAKTIAKASLLPGRQSVHKDDLFDIDDCLCIDRIGDWHLELIEDDEATRSEVINGYFPLPKSTIERWQNGIRESPESG